MVILEAKDNDESKDSICEVREDSEQKYGLEFVLHTVIRMFAGQVSDLVRLEEEAARLTILHAVM